MKNVGQLGLERSTNLCRSAGRVVSTNQGPAWTSTAGMACRNIRPAVKFNPKLYISDTRLKQNRDITDTIC